MLKALLVERAPLGAQVAEYLHPQVPGFREALKPVQTVVDPGRRCEAHLRIVPAGKGALWIFWFVIRHASRWAVGHRS
jgi:hypothetical protein